MTVPEGWIQCNLDSVSSISMGQSPPSSSYNYIGHGLPFLQGNSEFGYIYPEISQWTSDPRKIADKGAILISVRAPVGELNILKEKCCIGRGLAAISANHANRDYLYFALLSLGNAFNRVSQGSTFTAINGKELRELPFLLPPLPEQKKIAEILSSVDEAIQATQETIEQTKRVKKGLLQELLTRGIGHTRFKQTEIGEIPEEWEVVRLGSIVTFHKSGI